MNIVPKYVKNKTRWLLRHRGRIFDKSKPWSTGIPVSPIQTKRRIPSHVFALKNSGRILPQESWEFATPGSPKLKLPNVPLMRFLINEGDRFCHSFLSEHRIGSIVKVDLKTKESYYSFQGMLLKVHENGVNSTFTLRNIFKGFGVEQTFFLNSPSVLKISIMKKYKLEEPDLEKLRKSPQALEADKIYPEAIEVFEPKQVHFAGVIEEQVQ